MLWLWPLCKYTYRVIEQENMKKKLKYLHMFDKEQDLMTFFPFRNMDIFTYQFVNSCGSPIY